MVFSEMFLLGRKSVLVLPEAQVPVPLMLRSDDDDNENVIVSTSRLEVSLRPDSHK